MTPQTETIAVLDFGSQYSQLIARRIRECNVYSKVIPWSTTVDQLREESPTGIILSGGPSSVYEPGAPSIDPEIFNLGIPILGICYGMQLMVHTLGGKVIPGTAREYGRAAMQISNHSNLFKGVSSELKVWMSHGDKVSEVPVGIELSQNRQYRLCGSKNQGPRTLRNPVSSGSCTFAGRFKNNREFLPWHLRLPWQLDHGFIYRKIAD